jgi:hypothetical protein
MSRGRNATPGQLSLSITGHEETLGVECRGIFSSIYLREVLATSPDFPPEAEVKPLYEAVKARWQKNWLGLKKANEAYTRSQFIDPLLRELGWAFVPEQKLPAQKGALRKRPDYCLCRDEAAARRAAAADTAAESFREASTVLEAKKAGTPLDEVSRQETPGWFPSQQVQDYLQKAKDATGQRFFDWAILTNGHEWRLYCERAATDAYFAVEIARDEEFCSLEDFRLFFALFRPTSFERSPEARCPLDEIREESLKRQADLELNLRKRIFDVLEDLANGFRDHRPNAITEAGWPALYDNCLIFLYRLLFILYAESRYLLPVRPSGYRSNKRYRERFSLACKLDHLRDRANHYNSENITDLYDELLSLFHLIDGINPKLNVECAVARYNGGLFNQKLHPLIEKWRIPDRSLADVLRQLIFAQPPARRTARQLTISTEEAIDYSTLEVRQLGDIYEGLLGAKLAESDGRLVMVASDGSNHRDGIYYTPDWIVRYLLRETVTPLVDEIERSPTVQAALAAKSDEKRRDNSFAHGVLHLNLLDPAMGSGHFLVRATEWLADKIVRHDTTRRMTEQIVPVGQNKHSREEILRDGRIPVPPGVPQEQAETAYWRRRIVEACIYGVDLNPLAVELTKLSLWLTCIAVDEPLNFLDHHLRPGNSLLFARPNELNHPPPRPDLSPDQQQAFSLGQAVPEALRAVIAENTRIEGTPSTEMELVKQKEDAWKKVRDRLAPVLHVADLWLAALDDTLPNPEDYRLLALHALGGAGLARDEKSKAADLAAKLAPALEAKHTALQPLHWHLDFPDVFFSDDGTPLPATQAGFDAILGNPPYVSVHTSIAASYRAALGRRAGFAEDLYLHFTELGFDLLRPGGGFGFIVSDTFFTLDSKRRMRELLQSHRLDVLGQCDPFDATVDAAIFVASKVPPRTNHALFFVQARPRRAAARGKLTKPEDWLDHAPTPSAVMVPHGEVTDRNGIVQIRYHHVPASLYTGAHNRIFFEPRPQALKLFERFNSHVAQLVGQWWEAIKDSRSLAQYAAKIRDYQSKLTPGSVTLAGLIADGGQGLATANNARFLGYREGSQQAAAVAMKRIRWSAAWLDDAKIGPIFKKLLIECGGDPAKPTADGAAWEATIEPMRRQFGDRTLGFNKTDLYRIVPTALIATDDDYRFAWTRRKAELLARWQKAGELKEFWTGGLTDGLSTPVLTKLRTAKANAVDDTVFCRLCGDLHQWIAAGKAEHRAARHHAVGLRSMEFYDDPDDAPRIATIYNGLDGRGIFIDFRKSDPEGNRWLDNEPLYIDWSRDSVDYLSSSDKPRWQGHGFFLTEGITWTRVANHVAVKARFQAPCIFEVDSVRLTPNKGVMDPFVFLALLNSDVVSFFKMRFLLHTAKWEIGSLRQLPLVIPTTAQAKRLRELAERAMEAKRCEFSNQPPSQALAAFCRTAKDGLVAGAPAYLRPDAQEQLLATPQSCLAVIEHTVNWEAEKLYGVEGEGPFDEF